MMTAEVFEYYLKALNAYKAWIACGKDFVAHTHLFEEWDKAAQEFADVRNIKRNWAVIEIFHAIELENRKK